MVLASLPKHRPPSHAKKRHGQHHKVSKHYSKIYWPYLPMLLIVGLGFMVNTFWHGPSKVLDYATSMSNGALLQETNTQRIQNGLGALALNNTLSQAAQAKANDMVARDYWAHATPEGKQPWQFMSEAGYNYTLAGENLAYGFATSAETVAGWMNSPGHRANILKAGYKDVGFGVANSPNYQGTGPETVVVAMYAAPVAVAAPAPPAPKPAPLPTPVPQQTTPTPTPTPTPPTTVPPDTNETEQKPVTQQKQEASAPAPVNADDDLTSQPVSRIDVLTQGNAEWVVLTLSALVTIGAITLVYRHGKMWKRYIVEGEHFLVKHPWYDIAIVAAIVVCVLLTRTSGFVH
jgi:hypothetical protein